MLCAIAGLASFVLLYRDIAPRASIDLKYTRAEIMSIGRDYLRTMGYDLKQYQQDTWFGFDGNAQVFLQYRLRGMKNANAAIRADSLSTHNWYLNWYDKKLSRSQNPEQFEMWISPSGKILGFNHIIKDTVSLPSITKDEAEASARTFLAQQGFDLSSFKLRTSTDTKLSGRTDFFFRFGTADTTVDSNVWVRVQGNAVSGFRFDYQPAGAFQKEFSEIGTAATFIVTTSFAAVFLLFFFIVILFLKKYHEGEVGTKTAFMVFLGFLAVSIVAVTNEYSSIAADAQMGDLNKYNTRMVMFGMNIFIVQVFLGVMVFAAWSVGESSARSAWPKKLSATDSMLYRKFFSLDIGEGILRGYAWGLSILGGYALFLSTLQTNFEFGLYSQSPGRSQDSYVTFLQPFLVSVGIAVFSEVVFRLFFISFIKEKTGKQWLGVLVSTSIWSLTAFALWDIPFGHLQLSRSFVALFAFGLFFSFLFLKYDLLTAISANFILSGLNYAIPIFSSTGDSFGTTHLLIGGTYVFPLLVAIGGLVKRQRFEFSHETMPVHIQRITERERMAKELEIARRVQMSLLPKSSPSATGYDIAGTCIPALEVGGDYYDFVNLGGKKIGIAIGDVSGKGVPAAIYMTLTKGILQSHAEENISPKKVLSKVNNLMYRTIDRNSFVSMFYAILDMENKKIRFARAGQCPVIIAQRDHEQGIFLTPKGMALGLEVGVVFDSVLEEQELDVNPGEVLVFYTDGFTEAMTDRGDEFGETRLMQAIERHRDKSASEIINGICKDVDTFTKGFQQHDDMTMVVVKVG